MDRHNGISPATQVVYRFDHFEKVALESQDPVPHADNDCRDQLVPACEVVVHLRLARTCNASDLIQTHRPSASLDHQVRGSVYYSLTRDPTLLGQWQPT